MQTLVLDADRALWRTRGRLHLCFFGSTLHGCCIATGRRACDTTSTRVTAVHRISVAQARDRRSGRFEAQSQSHVKQAWRRDPHQPWPV